MANEDNLNNKNPNQEENNQFDIPEETFSDSQEDEIMAMLQAQLKELTKDIPEGFEIDGEGNAVIKPQDNSQIEKELPTLNTSEHEDVVENVIDKDEDKIQTETPVENPEVKSGSKIEVIADVENEDSENNYRAEIEAECASEEEQIKNATQTIKELNIAERWKKLDAATQNEMKKYVFQIAEEYVNLVEPLDKEERVAFINDAIEKKLLVDLQAKSTRRKISIVASILVMIFVAIVTLPVVMLITNRAILATFDNYRYSQESFEKLYKDKLFKNKQYRQSL